MATTRKTKKRTTKKRPTKRKAAPRKKTTKRAAPKWRCDKHPVTGKPCKGRAMSKRDQRLFTVTGKRRKGVGIVKIREAYGLRKPAKKKAAPKRKTTAKRKPAKRKATAKRKPAKRKAAPKRRTAKKTAPRGKLTPAQAKMNYFILDTSGRVVSSSKKITTIRAKYAQLTKQHPRRKFRVIKRSK
jgi:hypothetical protein